MDKEPSFRNENKIETLETALARIMTAKEYSRLEHATPYIFSLQAGGKELHYFGSPHVNDPDNPLFGEIETHFSMASPELVFLEGIDIKGEKKLIDDKIKIASRKEIIEKMGESGFAMKLAVEKDIVWRSPEPSDADLYDNLLTQGFSKKEIFAWELLRLLLQYNRMKDRSGFRPYTKNHIERFQRSTNWQEFDYSYEQAVGSGEKILGRKIDVENESQAADFTDPIPWEEKKDKQTVLNKIGEASAVFRDRKIVRDIADALRDHERILVVFGASHAVMQEPALRNLLSQK